MGLMQRTPAWKGIRDVRDGTANTIAISECMLGAPLCQSVGDWAGVAAAIGGANVGNPSSYQRGWSWYAAKFPHPWGFNAVVGPNDKITGGPLTGDSAAGNGSYASLAARSRHPGGVNCGMADGTVKFASETIDLFVWRAAASIAGGETGSLP